LSVLGGFSAWWTWRNFAGVRASFADWEPVPAQTDGMLAVEIDAGARRRHLIECEVQFDDRTSLSGLAPEARGRVALEVPYQFERRGVRAVVAARVSSSWPLGLWRCQRSVAAPKEIVVHPKAQSAGELRGNAGGFSDELARLGVRHGNLQPAGLREHRPGEPLQRVHWKASARRSNLVIQEWDGGAGAGFEVALDRRCSETTLDECLSILAWLSERAKERKETLTLRTQGWAATFGAHQRRWADLLRWLAGAAPVASGVLQSSPDAIQLPLRGARR
jgi:uncharacterized protein (DUF58 family)